MDQVAHEPWTFISVLEAGSPRIRYHQINTMYSYYAEVMSDKKTFEPEFMSSKNGDTIFKSCLCFQSLEYVYCM